MNNTGAHCGGGASCHNSDHCQVCWEMMSPEEVQAAIDETRELILKSRSQTQAGGSAQKLNDGRFTQPGMQASGRSASQSLASTSAVPSNNTASGQELLTQHERSREAMPSIASRLTKLEAVVESQTNSNMNAALQHTDTPWRVVRARGNPIPPTLPALHSYEDIYRLTDEERLAYVKYYIGDEPAQLRSISHEGLEAIITSFLGVNSTPPREKLERAVRRRVDAQHGVRSS